MSNKQYTVPISNTPGSSGGGGGSFSAITSGTNTTAAMVIGSGASLTESGTGTITANRLPAAVTTANTVTLSPTSGSVNTITTTTGNGLILESQEGDQLILNGGVQLQASTGTSLSLTDGGDGFQFTGTVISYGPNGTPTVAAGLVSIVANSHLTAQSAAIAATTIYTAPNAASPSGAGLYRVNYCASITTIDGSSGVLGGTTGFQVRYTDLNDSVVKTSNPATPVLGGSNATTTTISGAVYAYAKANTAIQYLMGYTGVGGQMRYDLTILVEYLG